MKLCRGCRWYLANRGDAKLSKAECSNPGNQYPDYVTGATKVNYLSAQSLRIDSQYCGPDAIWFEPILTLRGEYPDKYAGLKEDAIRTQGDTK